MAIILYPDDEFSVSVHVDYNSKVIGNQYATFNPGDDFARENLALPHVRLPARAGAADQHEPDQGRRPGQRHRDRREPRPGRTAGTPVRRSSTSPTSRSPGGLPQQPRTALQRTNCARHKLLDLLGDFALLGRAYQGPRLWPPAPGHFANTEFMKQLQARPSSRDSARNPRYQYDCRYSTPLYDINDIRRMLPHRPPFLLVDRIFHCDSLRPWPASRT